MWYNRGMKLTTLLVAVLSASVVFADEADKSKDKAQKAATPPDFSVVCSNAWLKCTTDGDPLKYSAGDEVKFSIAFMGVTNAIPPGKYMMKWTAKGLEETEAEGSRPLSKDPFVLTGKIASAGFARLDVQVTTADGKPFERVVGKQKKGVSVSCGAGADVSAILPPPEPKDLAKRVKDLKTRLAKVPFKKVERVEIPSPGLGGAKAYTVSLPCEGDQPVPGILCIPAGKSEGEKFPMCVEFEARDLSKPQPVPAAKRLSAGEATFFVAYQHKPKAERDDAYCTDLYLRVMRAVQYARTVPEWNGKDLYVRGWDFPGTLALWAAGCGEGVTRVNCGLVSRSVASEQFDPAVMARTIPATCFVEFLRAGLGDVERPPKEVAEIWNAMKCDRKITWVQGCTGWASPPWYKDRDFVMEKIRPMTYRNMKADHCKPFKPKQDNSFRDIEAVLTDRVIFEVVFDCDNPKSLPVQQLSEVKYSANRDLLPLAIYVTMPTRKVKEKSWAKFVELQEESPGIPFYFDAGMDLPVPMSMPWYHVVDVQGILRYSGDKLDAAKSALNRCYAALPEYDPVFSLARPVLLKDEVEKLAKLNLVGSKLYKAIEGVKRKYSRTFPEKSSEANHLLIGMRQALETRVMDISKRFHERAGLAYADLLVLVKEWPEAESNWSVKNMRESMSKNQELEKLVKLELELNRLRAWNPEKTSDVKKKEAALAALRAKAERFSKSKVASVQGEAMSIISDIDNPPQPAAQ